jgi:cytoskeletal protein CcmA (bactofilin family)
MTLSARLFGEEERAVKKDRGATAAGGGNLNAFLGEGTSFKGTLTFEGTVRIDGRLEGEIFTKDTLVIGEGAQVNAAIHAGVVVISGTVHGNITAERKIDIHASGRLFGNISTPSLVIEEGVVFEGSCTMGQGAEQAEQSSVADPERLFAR